MEESNNYEARLDKIFGKGSMWKHRTFRTVFDPFSSEWGQSTFDQKLDYLKRAVDGGEDLQILISDYKERYENQNRIDIANSVEDALILLLQFSLRKPKE